MSDAAAREQYAGAIVGQARRLGRLIANAATLSTPQQETPLVEVKVAEVLDEALRELADTTELQGIAVSVHLPAEPVSVFWSRAALRQLLIATLESVLDGAGEHATVTVELRPQARDVALIVSSQSEWSVPFCVESFAFRAAARLVGTRGGSLLWREGPQPHLQLQLPFSGRLAARPVEGLEQSA